MSTPAPLEWWAVTPTTAADALVTLEQAHDRWRQVLLATDDATLGLPLGPIGGQYAEASRAAFLIHQLDEIVRHGAEIGLLRDLYRAAAVNLTSIVDQLPAAGAITGIRDPQFNATLSQWAEFYGHHHLARRLADRGVADTG